MDSEWDACKNNLKQIGFALHNHHDTFRWFPAADSNGFPPGPQRKAGLSWRVYILGNVSEEGFLTLIADGSVRRIQFNINPDLLKLLIQHNDSQQVPQQF